MSPGEATGLNQERPIREVIDKVQALMSDETTRRDDETADTAPEVEQQRHQRRLGFRRAFAAMRVGSQLSSR